MSAGSVSPLRQVVHERFCVAFGPPKRVAGKDSQWSLRPGLPSEIAAVNVLMNGAGDLPTVWVFDPHDPSDGVSNHTVNHEWEIAPVIAGIEQRVSRACVRQAPTTPQAGT